MSTSKKKEKLNSSSEGVELVASALAEEANGDLPPGWTKRWSVRKGRYYYYHMPSGESSWERPTDVTDKKLKPRRDDESEVVIKTEAKGVVLRSEMVEATVKTSGSSSIAKKEVPAGTKPNLKRSSEEAFQDTGLVPKLSAGNSAKMVVGNMVSVSGPNGFVAKALPAEKAQILSPGTKLASVPAIANKNSVALIAKPAKELISRRNDSPVLAAAKYVRSPVNSPPIGLTKVSAFAETVNSSPRKLVQFNVKQSKAAISANLGKSNLVAKAPESPAISPAAKTATAAKLESIRPKQTVPESSVSNFRSNASSSVPSPRNCKAPETPGPVIALPPQRMELVTSWVNSLSSQVGAGGECVGGSGPTAGGSDFASSFSAYPLPSFAAGAKCATKSTASSASSAKVNDLVSSPLRSSFEDSYHHPHLSSGGEEEEDMEVEYSEECKQLVQDVCSLRESFRSDDSLNLQGHLADQFLFYRDQNGMDRSPSPEATKSLGKLFVVIDTNVLLDCLKFVDELKEEKQQGFGQLPHLVIPWVVLQELDALKDNRRATQIGLKTQFRARNAINYLNTCLQTKHKRLIVQTPSEAIEQVPEIKPHNNDDKILVCCMQTKKKEVNSAVSQSQVVLFTLDKNLRNKAMVLGLLTFNKEGLVAWLQQQRHHVTTASSTVKSISAVKDDSKPKPVSREVELKLTDEVQCEIRGILKPLLTEVVTQEMKEAYGDLWLSIIALQPPWTLTDALECLNKHWMSVFGMFLPRAAKIYANNLWENFKPGAGTGGQLKNRTQTKFLLKECVELVEYLKKHSPYNGEAVKALERLGELDTLVAAALECTLDLPGDLSALRRMVESRKSGAAMKTNASSTVQTSSIITMTAGVATSPSSSLQPNINTITTSEALRKTAAESCANFSTSQTLESEELVVQQSFQIVWEAILFFEESLEQRLAVAAPLQQQQGVRQEALTFLVKFCSLVTDLQRSYLSMLGVTAEEANAQFTVFCRVCFALNNFAQKMEVQPWRTINGYMLKNFYVDARRRELLQNGYSQLQEMIERLGKCQQLLTPQETALLNGTQLCNMAVS